MPREHRLSNPKLIFTTKNGGYSYLRIFQALQSLEYVKPIILLLKCADDEIFGAFLDFHKAPDSKAVVDWVSSNNSFVFKLLPQV